MYHRLLVILLFILLPIQVWGQTMNEPLATTKDSLRNLVDNSDDSSEVYSALRQLMMIEDDVELQMDYAKRQYAIAEYLCDTVKIMNSLAHIGVCYNNTGLSSDGMDYSFKALLLARKLHDRNLEAQCLFNIATFYSEDMNDEALDYFIKAIDLSKELQNYSTLESLYYNMAIFYLERDIFNMAVDYLEMARDAYMMGGQINVSSTTEYNLTIRATKLLYYFQMRDTASILPLLDSLNSSIEISREIDNFPSRANFHMALCDCNLRAIDFVANECQATYLHHARKHLDNLMLVIDTYNVQWLITDSYNNLYARLLMANGQYRKAGELIRNPENFSNDYDYAKVRYKYYIHEGEYKKALEVSDFLKRYSYSLLSIQKAVNYDNLQSKREYEQQLQQIQRQADARNKEYNHSLEFNDLLIRHAIILLIILIIVIVFFLIWHHSNNKLKDKLLLLNADISQQHALLSNQQDQIMQQTSEIRNQSLLIQQQRDDLEETNHYLTHSIIVGADIQKAFLYNEQQVSELLGKCFVFWKPLYMVSGDFYWASRIVDRQFVFVADCTGHGVPGALLSMYGIAMLNDYVKRNANRNAAEILEIIKAAYLDQFVRGDEFLCDGMDCALLIINREEMTVNYAGARRPLILVRDGEVHEHRPDKISIGNNPMRPNTKFTNHIIDIQHGDMLFAFSDGIADQFGGDDSSTKFGNRQLQEILSEISFLDTTIQKTIIASVVENWRRGPYYAGLASKEVAQLDDQLLIGVRV